MNCIFRHANKTACVLASVKKNRTTPAAQQLNVHTAPAAQQQNGHTAPAAQQLNVHTAPAAQQLNVHTAPAAQQQNGHTAATVTGLPNQPPALNYHPTNFINVCNVGGLTIQCDKCNAPKFKKETNKFSCGNGKYKLDIRPPLPQKFDALFV